MDALMRFPTAVARDPAIDPWLATRPPELRPLAEACFARLRACGDDVRELMHDGWPTATVEDAAFAHVSVHRAHVGLYLFFGALLPDPAGLLEGTGKRGRHVKLRSDRLPDAAALDALIAAAYADIRARLADYSSSRHRNV